MNNSQMIEDLYKTKRLLECTLSRDVADRNYFQYTRLLSLYSITSPKMDMGVIISREEQKRLSKLVTSRFEKLDKYADYINTNASDLCEISKSNNKMFNDMDFVFFYIPEKSKVFDMEDYLDIVLTFFEKYGFYEIACKYFEENRVNLIVKSRKPNGEYVSIPNLKSGYIKSEARTIDSTSASILAHEMGHAIDSETFLFPQQKKIANFNDLLLEVPSTAIEVLFNDYLVSEHLDEFGGLLLKNQKAEMLKMYSELYLKSLCYDCYFFNEDGDIIDAESGSGYADFRDAIIYGLGYQFAYHLLRVAREDPKEFARLYNRLITSRAECPRLRDSIEKIGVNPEEFISSELIKPILEEDHMLLRKKIQRY